MVLGAGFGVEAAGSVGPHGSVLDDLGALGAGFGTSLSVLKCFEPGSEGSGTPVVSDFSLSDVEESGLTSSFAGFSSLFSSGGGDFGSPDPLRFCMTDLKEKLEASGSAFDCFSEAVSEVEGFLLLEVASETKAGLVAFLKGESERVSFDKETDVVTFSMGGLQTEASTVEESESDDCLELASGSESEILIVSQGVSETEGGLEVSFNSESETEADLFTLSKSESEIEANTVEESKRDGGLKFSFNSGSESEAGLLIFSMGDSETDTIGEFDPEEEALDVLEAALDSKSKTEAGVAGGPEPSGTEAELEAPDCLPFSKRDAAAGLREIELEEAFDSKSNAEAGLEEGE